MKYQKLHSWNVSPKEAILIQKELAKKIVLKTTLSEINKIAACDVGFAKDSNKVVGVVCVFGFPGLNLIERIVKTDRANFPYIPGLLTFREGPILLKTFSFIKNRLDLILFDGQGITHPRQMGLATHMGIILNLPTIGCAKKPLFGSFREPGNFKGAYTYIYSKNRKIIGASVRTRKDVHCIFVSPGYKINLKDAIKVVLSCTTHYRIPKPLRAAHSFTRIKQL